MRAQLTDAHIDLAHEEVQAMLYKRLRQKGRGILVSSHEIAGVVEEERREMWAAVEANDAERLEDELVDIAVAALVGLASLRTGKVQ